MKKEQISVPDHDNLYPEKEVLLYKLFCTKIQFVVGKNKKQKK